MPQYLRKPYKLVSRGVGLRHPYDLLPDGLYPRLNNMEVSQLGQLTSRAGIEPLNAITYPDPVHSMRRLQDTTDDTTALIVGSGTKLYTSASATEIDTGYSGHPLSMVRMRPPQSPRPWMYIGDHTKMRKVLADGIDYPIGTLPPGTAPTVTRGTPNYIVIEPFESGAGWTNTGTAGAISTPNRFNTTIAAILYDTGTTGWACINPTAIDANLQVGALLILTQGGTVETVKVRAVFNPVVTTTIAGIIYDSGSTGLCSIILTNQTTGLEPDSMLLIAGAEYVRVLSVTNAPNGLVSFRCSTTSNRIAGNAVAGVASFRAYTVAAFAATDTITGKAFQSTVTTGLGWLSKDTTGAPLNLASSNNRPIQPEDYLHISVQVDNPANVTQGRVILSIDPAFPADFSQLKNAFYKDFGPNVFQGVTNNTLTDLAGQQAAIQRQVINELTLQVPYRSGGQPFTPPPQGLVTDPNAHPEATQQVPGTSAWTELTFKVSDLVRAGSDQSRSLANVTGLIIQLQTTASTVLLVDSWWIGGTYGLDSTGNVPYTFYERFRATSSGAKSNPSPFQRASLALQRELAILTPVASGDVQVNTIDVFAQGGALSSPTLVASAPNVATPLNIDVTDSSVAVNEQLSFTNFQPFPLSDLPRAGTCSTVGTIVLWSSGDPFNIQWQPGSQVIINSVVYTLYASPTSTLQLELVENAGVQNAVVFSIPEATLGAQPLASIWGPDPLTGVMFGVGTDLEAGYLFWTNPNDPDSASDSNYYEVCSPSEPLLSGFMYNGSSYVRSTEKLYRAIGQTQSDPTTGAQTITYRTQEVPELKGTFDHTASAVGDLLWTVTREGIYESAGGAPQSITDETIYNLFSHGGAETGTLTNGYYPIDFSISHAVRLYYTKGALYFAYQDTNTNRQLWKYDRTIPQPGWFHLSYTGKEPRVVYENEEEGTTDIYMAGSTGIVYLLGHGTDDDGTAISFSWQTPAYDLGDPRAQKLALDYMLDADLNGLTISAALYGNNLGTLINTNSISGTGRLQYPETAIESTLALYRNFGLLVSGTGSGATFFEFEPNCLLQPYVALNFSNQYQSHRFTNYGHIRDGWIMYISTTVLTLTITVDGGTPYTFTIPSSAGLPSKLYLFDAQITQPSASSFQRKGRIFLYSVTSTSPFALFTDETIINAKEWGSTGPYNAFKPFVGQTA